MSGTAKCRKKNASKFMTPSDPLATAMAQASYYARRAGYLEGALLVISWGTSGVDPQEAATRALEAAGEDEYARRLQRAETS